MNERGQATGILTFALILGVAALLWGLLDPAATQIFESSLSTTSNQQAQAVINERATIWDNILFFIVAFAGVFLISRSVFQST